MNGKDSKKSSSLLSETLFDVDTVVVLTPYKHVSFSVTGLPRVDSVS